MKLHLKYLVYIIVTAIISINTSCISNKSNHDGITLTASISPVKYLVETITCGDFPVEVLVPSGASPESYSPTASQMVDIENSRMIFTTGLLDFETELVSKLRNNVGEIVNLSNGITLLEGTCEHSNTHSATSHNHGTDPHIWSSPEKLKLMSTNIYNAISNAYPDSVKYKKAYDKLILRLDSLSASVSDKLYTSGVKCFIIYHPALTYFANDYGLTQLSLESEGKEPSAQHMRSIVDAAHANDLKYILYQKQFSRSVVEAIANEISGEPIEIDPLAENVIEEINRITEIITTQK